MNTSLMEYCLNYMVLFKFYIGPLYVTFSYSIWIFCRGISVFATDCPCDVWCRGLTTCLLHVGPPFGNRFLNTSKFDILDSISSFFLFWHMRLYLSWYIINFFGFIFTSLTFFIFSSTPLLTSSIDVVFVLSFLMEFRGCIGFIEIFHRYCCYTKRGGITTNLTLRNH